MSAEYTLQEVLIMIAMAMMSGSDWEELLRTKVEQKLGVNKETGKTKPNQNAEQTSN